MDVRLLTEHDAANFQRLRLRSLQEHPEAFGASYEDEEKIPVEKAAESLKNGPPNSYTFGAFINDEMVGLVAIQRSPRRKLAHRASIGGMYVTPEARGHGAGRTLLDAVIRQAKAMNGVEDIALAVTVGNESARRLYLNAGFQSYSIDPRFIAVGDARHDIEWMILSLG